MMPASVISSPETLAAAWAQLKEEEPSLLIRSAAERLQTTEAQLLATGMLDGSVIRLHTTDWPALLQAFKSLGHVMSLTRNHGCVLEHKGAFEEIDVIKAPHGDMATVLGPIEQRVFFKHWAFAFAAQLPGQQGKIMRSIQVFDRAGDAIMKVFLQDDGHHTAYEAMIAEFRQPEQVVLLTTEPIAPLATEPLAQIDRQAFLEEWTALQDTHDYFGMLRRHKVAREDAMRIALGRFTREVAPTALQAMLETVSKPPRLPIMIFTGNKGNIQIHQDEVRHIKTMGPWLNVLDPDFNMHLDMQTIARVYEVHKPTSDGQVTSLECFDPSGEMIVQFFGLRKPGIPEREDWRTLVAQLPGIN